MDGGLMVQKILPAEIITQNAAFAVVMFLGTGAMRISTTAPTAGRRWMEDLTMRPVDADAIYNKALENLKKGEIEDWEADSIIDYLDDAPTINDAEIVVRCRDCAAWKRNVGIVDSPNGHCFEHDIDTNGQDFCSYGVKKGETPK
nr:MAG TPA: hypothetical protein [Caudoviricetes sp.]